MKAKHLKLTLADGVKNEFLVTACTKDYVWENGKQTDKLKGYKLRTVCPSAGFEETFVKIETSKEPLNADSLEENPVAVSFEELTFTSYYSLATKRIEYSASAKGLKVIKA